MTSPIPRLGLVCMTAGPAVRFRELTLTRLARLPEANQRAVLRDIYRHNLQQLANALAFCKKENIHLYRFYSNTFPFADTEVGESELLSLSDELKRLGEEINKSKIRIVSHPDQFVVLNSDRSEVIENSIRVLDTHSKIFDLLEQPRSPWAACNIHPGKANRREKLLETIEKLPNNIKSRLTLENDEYSYDAESTYAICQSAGIPMVFDAHHHLVCNRCDNYDDPSLAKMCEKARQTWAPNENWQLVHISNGANALNDRKHHDFISQFPACFMNVEWVEVEAKKKELAIKKFHSIIADNKQKKTHVLTKDPNALNQGIWLTE